MVRINGRKLKIKASGYRRFVAKLSSIPVRIAFKAEFNRISCGNGIHSCATLGQDSALPGEAVPVASGRSLRKLQRRSSNIIAHPRVDIRVDIHFIPSH
ncbi:hypothetical protein D3C81_2104230 [compost metagenome]